MSEIDMGVGDQIRDELMTLKKASKDGLLHSSTVVDWARKHPNSQLHSHLEWDDSVAAEEYRKSQVRLLIHIYVRTDDNRPMLISLMPDRVNGGGYREVSEVSRSKRLSELAEQEVTRELFRVFRKYSHIKRFAEIWRAIQKEIPEDEASEAAE